MSSYSIFIIRRLLCSQLISPQNLRCSIDVDYCVSHMLAIDLTLSYLSLQYSNQWSKRHFIEAAEDVIFKHLFVSMTDKTEI